MTIAKAALGSGALAGHLFLCASPALAHVSEQGLVLLLPTGHYITAGVLAVAASIVLMAFTPRRLADRVFQPLGAWPVLPSKLSMMTSLLATAVCAALVYVGFTGPRDPLTNLLPLSVWVGFWIILFSLVGLTGNLWRDLNPWSGLYELVMGPDAKCLVLLPDKLGALPGLVVFLAFSSFYVADPAPADPDRLALITALYWVFTFAAMILFGGATWMERGEAFSILFTLIARVSPFGDGAVPRMGAPGWDLVPVKPMAVSMGVFAIAILGVGSFDGLKETFWWLGVIGVNPLEFPGRSFVVTSSLLGIAASTLGLAAMFTLAIWLGEVLARAATPGASRVGPLTLFSRFAPTILPIALGYHISHFLVTFLVDGQYLLAAIGDPLAQGANFFGLGATRVTTGFLNTPDSVKWIWLSQAGIVVIGHILAVLVSHQIALSIWPTHRQAVISQLPIAAFMIVYTLFGLWLLAAPRGI